MYVSLKDVATQAGVSFQTASKVLNSQRGVVSEATRQRILDAARELGYVPNALARGLVSQSSLTMGVLADEFADPALAQFVTAAHRWAGAHGQATLTVNVEPGADPGPAIRILHEHRVGGILVVAPSLEADPRLGPALRNSLPAVSLNHVPGGGVPLVGSDHGETGALAARHLVELGHREIGTVIGPRERRVVTSRLKGFRAGLQQAGVPLPARRVVEADWTTEGGYTGAHALLDAEPDVTAIFAHNDSMAVGVLRALAERQRRVPEDCSLVGCDDLRLAAYLNPPLTTVRVPFTETGERAADLLMRSIRGEKIARLELLPTQLVVRDSTSPPRQDRPGLRGSGSQPTKARRTEGTR